MVCSDADRGAVGFLRLLIRHVRIEQRIAKHSMRMCREVCSRRDDGVDPLVHNLRYSFDMESRLPPNIEILAIVEAASVAQTRLVG